MRGDPTSSDGHDEDAAPPDSANDLTPIGEILPEVQAIIREMRADVRAVLATGPTPQTPLDRIEMVTARLEAVVDQLGDLAELWSVSLDRLTDPTHPLFVGRHER